MEYPGRVVKLEEADASVVQAVRGQLTRLAVVLRLRLLLLRRGVEEAGPAEESHGAHRRLSRSLEQGAFPGRGTHPRGRGHGRPHVGEARNSSWTTERAVATPAWSTRSRPACCAPSRAIPMRARPAKAAVGAQPLGEPTVGGPGARRPCSLGGGPNNNVGHQGGSGLCLSPSSGRARVSLLGALPRA